MQEAAWLASKQRQGTSWSACGGWSTSCASASSGSFSSACGSSSRARPQQQLVAFAVRRQRRRVLAAHEQRGRRAAPLSHDASPQSGRLCAAAQGALRRPCGADAQHEDGRRCTVLRCTGLGSISPCLSYVLSQIAAGMSDARGITQLQPKRPKERNVAVRAPARAAPVAGAFLRMRGCFKPLSDGAQCRNKAPAGGPVCSVQPASRRPKRMPVFTARSLSLVIMASASHRIPPLHRAAVRVAPLPLHVGPFAAAAPRARHQPPPQRVHRLYQRCEAALGSGYTAACAMVPAQSTRRAGHSSPGFCVRQRCGDACVRTVHSGRAPMEQLRVARGAAHSSAGEQGGAMIWGYDLRAGRVALIGVCSVLLSAIAAERCPRQPGTRFAGTLART